MSMGIFRHLKLVLKIMAIPPPGPEVCGELKKAQSGAERSPSDFKTPGLSQGSVTNKKSPVNEIQKRIKDLFKINLAFTKAILTVTEFVLLEELIAESFSKPRLFKLTFLTLIT